MDSVQLNALKLYIDHAANILSENAPSGVHQQENGQILFLGNCHDSIPRLLIQDSALNAIEKIAWQHIRISVDDPNKPSVMPKIADLMAMLGCSKPTAIRSVQVLRMMRWVTLCKEVRAQDGRNCGRIFALHDEPLSLADTLILDAGYIDFLNDSAISSTRRLQELATGVLASIDDQIEDDNCNILQGRSQLEQAVARMAAPQDSENNHYFFAIKPSDSCKVNNFYPDSEAENSKVKNIDPDYSSSGIYKNTTTTVVLTYPKPFNHHERKIARRIVSKIVCSDDQQYLLDYMADRLKAAEQGRSKAIHDRLAYLNTIVKHFIDGKLEPSSYGIPKENNSDISTPAKYVNKAIESARAKEFREEIIATHGPNPIRNAIRSMTNANNTQK